MTELTPLYMSISSVYNGPSLGLPHRDAMSEGVVLPGDLAVTGQGGANSINIAQGSAWVVGDTDTFRQPTYRVQNDATVNLGISPDPSNPRIVRVGLQIEDADFATTNRRVVLTALHGTPAGVPVAPAEPASFCSLATILVPAAAATSAVYTFTDVRPRARTGGGAAQLGTAAGLAPVVYDRSVTSLDINTNATEQTLYSRLIGAGDLGTDRFLELVMSGDFLHNNVAGDTITFKVKYGGTIMWQGVWNLGNVLSAIRHPWAARLNLSNLGGVTNAQDLDGNLWIPSSADTAAAAGIGVLPVTNASGFPVIGGSATVDSTVAQTFEVTIQWSASNANDSWRRRKARLVLY